MADSPSSAIDYASYLALDELLSLQRPRSSPTHPDELLFIIVHQSSELWFKLMLHEMDALIACLLAGADGGGDPLGAVAVLKRLNGLVGIVSAQLSALETLPPQRFAEFRGYLGASSGSQSAQFRALEAASGMRDPHFLHLLRETGAPAPIVERALQRPTLEELFMRMLAARGRTLEDVYARGGDAPLFMLAEALLEYEQGFARWRFLHVQLVERIIGPDTGGTGGTLGARYLQRTVQQRFFPQLWAVRARFYGAGSEGGRTPSGA
jgi:tryptophan 2,3-dioxygenase